MRVFLDANILFFVNDRPVLAAAIHRQCAILLTGDKTRFGPLDGTTVSGVTIHSPAILAVFLERLEERN